MEFVFAASEISMKFQIFLVQAEYSIFSFILMVFVA